MMSLVMSIQLKASNSMVKAFGRMISYFERLENQNCMGVKITIKHKEKAHNLSLDKKKQYAISLTNARKSSFTPNKNDVLAEKRGYGSQLYHGKIAFRHIVKKRKQQ